MNLDELYQEIKPSMQAELRELRRQLYHTPKWRKIKRLNLFEKINRLEEDIGLLDHVLLVEDESAYRSYAAPTASTF